MFRRHRNVESSAWSRHRLLTLLGAAATAVVALITGLGLFAWYAISGTGASEAAVAPATESAVVVPDRDRIAGEPMASVDPGAAFTPDPALTPAGEIRVPLPEAESGPAGVPTGFPRTPEGAVGQLAAIEKRVLEAMSLPMVREVHRSWVQPGGPSFEDWELTSNVLAFLASARQGGDEKDPNTVVTVTPTAAMVKGSDGPDWTVVCVLVDVQVVIRAESRMGYGLCSRMAWVQGRWQIAPGEPPARAPQAWSGSNAAAEAGWLTWVEEVGE